MKQKRERKIKKKIRDYKISMIRLNEEEYDYFINKANILGWELAPTIRRLALKSKLTIVSKTDIETKIQLRKIGVNINQVVKKLNTIHKGKEVESDNEIMKIFIEDMKIFIEEIKKTIKKIE